MPILLVFKEKTVSLKVRLRSQRRLPFPCDKVILSTGRKDSWVGSPLPPQLCCLHRLLNHQLNPQLPPL